MLDQSILKRKKTDGKLITLGIVSRAHGIKGQVIIKSFTTPPENIVNLIIFDQAENNIKLKLIRVKANKELICRLDNYTSRTDAEKLVKKHLYCFRDSLPAILEKDEFYIEDLKYLKVYDIHQSYIGDIINVVNYGGGDIIEIKFIKDKKVEMFSFTKKSFPKITNCYVILVY